MKYVKIADYDNEKERLNFEEAKAAAKKKGCHLLTESEWKAMPNDEVKRLYSCIPFWGTSNDSLAARGYGDFDDDGRRIVGLVGRPSIRLGVLGTPIEKETDARRRE